MKRSNVIFLCVTILVSNTGITKAAEEDCPCKNERTLQDQDFGMALPPDFFSLMSPWGFHDYFRPWRLMTSLAKDAVSNIKADKDKFQINLDVKHFAPEEILVKTSNGYVVVEAKHEEKKDEHGSVSRQFVRKYSLPDDAESENVVSELSSDGVLTITAPRKVIDEKGERVVPITKTGPVRMVKETQDKEGTCEANGQSCNNP